MLKLMRKFNKKDGDFSPEIIPDLYRQQNRFSKRQIQKLGKKSTQAEKM